MQDFDHIAIEKLNLSRRTYHALARSGVLTIANLRQFYKDKDKYQIRNIGQKSLDEISKALDGLYKTPPQITEVEKTFYQPPIIANSASINTLDHVSIDDLQLPRAIRGSLKKNRIKTLGELRSLSDRELLNINRIGPKSLKEIRQIITDAINKPNEYIIKNTVNQSIQPKPVTASPILQTQPIENWAEIIQSYFESEKNTYTYILTSRFGLSPKKLEEIAKELGVTRERVRQIQELVSGRFLKYLKFSANEFSSSNVFLEKIKKILSAYGDKLSLTSFKKLLQKENLLGEFSETNMSERIENIDLLETLICWLNLLADKRYNMQPVVFPIDIHELAKSRNLSIKDRDILLNISTKDRRRIKRKILFTGGITVKETSKILSKDERITVLLLKTLNLQKIDDEWFTFKSLTADQDNSKIPLRIAGLKMLAVTPIMNFDSFHDGLRRHASRFYAGIAPIHVIEHALPMLGFDIKNHEVSTQLSTKGILSKSEQCLISAIKKNGGIASFLEIAEEFFLHNLSLPAVSVTLKRSPIAEKVNEGFHKLRDTEIPWQQIEEAKKRQKRFSQEDEVTHGLDGVVRMKFTVNSYAFLTGVVGAYSVKELSGSWSVVNKGKSYGEAKMDEVYLWGLAKVFKELDVRMGDRMELGFNMWNRSLSVERIDHGSS
ncbi:MAG: hypothetical protein FJZ86_15085 [Chloroflexi bacterium]|nr:hypothetical protein [Chloroflexota bacterium]